MKLNAGLQPSARALFLGSDLNRRCVLIPDQDPDPHLLGGLHGDGCDQVVLVEQERAGIDQHVYRVSRARDQLMPQAVRH